MADFKATAQLNIETLTDKAQSDILALNELMRRKLNPAEFGEFTPTQDAALEQGLQTRAAALTQQRGTEVTPEQVKKEMQDLFALEQQIQATQESQNRAREEANQKLEKAKLEEQILVDQKAEALKLLGMQEGE